MFKRKSDTLEKSLPFILKTLKEDSGNVLFLISPEAYDSYPNSRDDVLSPFINSHDHEFNVKQRLGGMDTNSTTMMKNIQADLDAIKQQRKVKTDQGYFDRIVMSVFTKPTDDFDDLENRLRALSDVSVYIIE